MKVLKEAKENLPIDFITSFVSKGWEEVGNIKASIDGIRTNFKGTKDVENILQDLVDAYLIAIGQLELHLDNKDYIDLPDEEKLSESLLESSNREDAEPFQARKFEDNNKTEIFTELPDYDVEVEQKGNKIEIELDPKDDTETVEFKNEKSSSDNFEYFTNFDDPEVDSTEESAYHQWINHVRQ